MYCLFNGEYGEHDESELPVTSSLSTNLKIMEENYAKWPGTVVGDFECLKVEYDWGKRDQRWTVKCQLCGEISYRYHVQDWRRGKGQKTYCHCRKGAENAEREKAKAEKAEQRDAERKQRIDNLVGKVFFGWKVTDDYDGSAKVPIVCVDCGRMRNVRAKELESGGIVACNHKKYKDYSGDEWIGKKEGHLTTIGRDGMMFIAQCDCGEIIRVRPTDLFTSKRKRACASPDCPYCNQYEREVRQRRERGLEFERDTYSELKAKGLNIEKTQDIADFGVDMVIYNDDGTKIAVQAKKENHPIGVEAMQEVYAGGRFYDCEKFAVISYSGFSKRAITMARKLGIYCCEGEFDYPDDIQDYCVSLVPTVVSKQNPHARKEYEIDGERHTLADWCAIYGKSEKDATRWLKRNVTLETFLKNDLKDFGKRKVYNAFGKSGTLVELCHEYGVLSPTVSYRMKKMGMTLEEALTAPNQNESASDNYEIHDMLSQGMSKKEIANKLGVTRQTIRNRLNNEKHPADRQITQSANTETR